MDKQYLELMNHGHPGVKASLSQLNIGDSFVLMRKRFNLTREACAQRGVRFLPAQVLRPIYTAAGL